jgi:hypothetical protein
MQSEEMPRGAETRALTTDRRVNSREDCGVTGWGVAQSVSRINQEQDVDHHVNRGVLNQ